MTVENTQKIIDYTVLGVAIVTGLAGFVGLAIAGVAIYLASKI